MLNVDEAIEETGVYMWKAHVTKLMGWVQLPLCRFQCDLKPEMTLIALTPTKDLLAFCDTAFYFLVYQALFVNVLLSLL